MNVRIACLLLALCALGAAARAARADGTAAEPPRLTRSDLELLPLDEVARARFVRENATLVQRLEVLLGRSERVERNLREREKPDTTPDSGVLALREEQARLSEQIAAAVPDLEARLGAAGVPASALARVRAAPRGPLRAERYAQALTLEVTDPSPEQRRVLEPLVAAVGGALLALEGEVVRLKQATGDEAAALQALAERLVQRQRRLEKRFWRVVDAVLTTPQRVVLSGWLPTGLSQHEDAIAHVYLLPDLTASQGVQFKALLLEIEAEASADTAEMRQHQAALEAKGLSEAERRGHERALADAGARLEDLRARARAQGLALLTPEQVAELKGVPPHVSGADRREPPQNALREIPTEASQRAALAALATRYLGAKREIEGGYLEIQRRLNDASPDSPEREMAEMMAAGLGGRVASVLREAYGEVFLRILAPDQVVGWVLCLNDRER